MNFNFFFLILLAAGLCMLFSRQVKSFSWVQRLLTFLKTRVSLQTLPHWLPFFHSLLLFLTGFLEWLFPEYVKALSLFSFVDYPWAYYAGLAMGEIPEAERALRIYLVLFFGGAIYWFLLGTVLKLIGNAVLKSKGSMGRQ